jgi:hypothetical protein
MSEKLPFDQFPYTQIKKPGFQHTLNTNAMNQLIQIKPSVYDLNKITGSATFKNKDTTLQIEQFSNLAIKRFSITCRYLFIALIQEFNNSGKKSKIITLPIKKYIELRNLKDKKSALEQIERDLRILISSRVEYSKKNNKSKKKSDANFSIINLFQRGDIKNKNIEVLLGDFFYDYLVDAYPIPINESLFKLDPQTSTFSLGWYFFTHLNQNQNKSNANKITVKTLLQACPTIPERQNASDHPLQLIIKPFINSINYLIKKEILLTADYLDTKGNALTEEQFGKLSYEEFIECSVLFTIKNYPIKLVSKKRGRKKKLKT